MSLLHRFHPFYVPVHRSTVGAVNSLINTALQSHNTDISLMNKEQALSTIELAVTTIQQSKTRGNNLQRELEALRDTCAGHDAVVNALNTQINSLVEEDKVIDEALAGLAKAASGDDAPPVEPPVTEPEQEPIKTPEEIEFEAGAAIAREGGTLPDEASASAKAGFASVTAGRDLNPEA